MGPIPDFIWILRLFDSRDWTPVIHIICIPFRCDWRLYPFLDSWEVPVLNIVRDCAIWHCPEWPFQYPVINIREPLYRGRGNHFWVRRFIEHFWWDWGMVRRFLLFRHWNNWNLFPRFLGFWFLLLCWAPGFGRSNFWLLWFLTTKGRSNLWVICLQWSFCFWWRG